MRKARPDLLTTGSVFEEALVSWLDSMVRAVTKVVEVPVTDPDRCYVGEVVRDVGGGLRMRVQVEGDGVRRPLVDAKQAWSRKWGDFGWGYPGGGPHWLAASLLADAAGGDIALAEAMLAKAQRRGVGHTLPSA